MRLSRSTLASLPGSVGVPKRRWSGPGIVHLGIGAFHRAHQAVMQQAAMDAGETGWGIVAASLRSPDTRDALKPQDGLYTVAVQSPTGERLQVIGAVGDVLVAPENPGALIACMSDPRIRIVSMTVSEKGYCHNPADGTLNEAHPDIIHDLANPDRPRSTPGFLVAALARRRAAGIAPFTILCCDNLPSNGQTVRRVVSRFAERVDPALGRFVAGEVAFPLTMVDRIVPATTDADRERISAALGVRDAWPVVTEPFTQWVIEENFPTGRPRWELGGAQFVRDVEPFELMKLRMLNGAHSTLAYLGAVAGHETVADASNDPAFAAVLRRLWTEIIPSLKEPEGQPPSAYAEALLERFRNTAIRHRLLQIAMDGSQKLPQRLLGTVADNLAAGRPIRFLALGVAAWMRFVMGANEAGIRHQINDPLAGQVSAVAAAAGRDAPALADGLLAIEAIFAPGLAANARFRAAVTEQLASLIEKGVVATIAAQS